jgi:hypothetical protein
MQVLRVRIVIICISTCLEVYLFEIINLIYSRKSSWNNAGILRIEHTFIPVRIRGIFDHFDVCSSNSLKILSSLHLQYKLDSVCPSCLPDSDLMIATSRFGASGALITMLIFGLDSRRGVAYIESLTSSALS